jgi:hypothetical protein
MFDGLASFDRHEAEVWLRDQLYGFRKENLDIREFVCRIRKLDDLNVKPFFIKLDVQGYEYKALKGAEATLRKSLPVLLVEAPKADTIAFLGELGYTMYIYRDGRFVPSEEGDPNAFFFTPDKAELVKRYIDA